jgi:hypothetical protein
MTQYPRLPDPPEQTAGEPGEQYGSRLVCWLLAHDRITATLTDEQANRAHWATTAALSSRVTIGRDADISCSPAIVYDRLEDLRRDLWASLTGRGLTQPAPAADPIGPPADEHSGGRLAPLVPVRPSYPPAASHVDIRF